MTARITVRIEAQLAEQLEAAAERRGRTPSALARELLERQLAAAPLDRLRRQIMPFAGARGYVTDEDLFRDVS